MIGDHMDELFPLFGAPFLKGDGPLVTTNLGMGDLGSSFSLVSLGKFLLFTSQFLEFTITRVNYNSCQSFSYSNVNDG